MIIIIDYNAGNVKSVANMMRAIGVSSCISGDVGDIGSADKLILPGVGHFDHGMGELERRGLVELLNERVLEAGVPILGICLGVQLFTRSSEEGQKKGLGWIDGRTVRFDRTQMGPALRVPHMGWADTSAVRQSPLSEGLPEDARFYYVHSYHIVCDRSDQVIFGAEHGITFTAGVQKGNILGVQFHPEKSHRFGMQILRNFSAWQPGGGEQRAIA